MIPWILKRERLKGMDYLGIPPLTPMWNVSNLLLKSISLAINV